MNASVPSGRNVFRCSLGLCAALALPFAASGQFIANNLWVQGGHGARVNALACTSDGSLIATASDDDTVKLWNTNGTLLRTFNTSPYPATAVAISPDNSKLAIGTYAGGYVSGSNGLGQVFLWQASSGSLVTNASLIWSNSLRFGKVSSLAFSADNRLLAAGNGTGSNNILAVSTGTVVTNLKGFSMAPGTAVITGVAFSSGGLLASGAEDASLFVWNTNAWTTSYFTSTTQTSNITAVAFSASGAYLASASLDQTIRVWNTSTWSSTLIVGPANGITTLAFSPDGTRVAGGTSNGTVNVWNAQTGSLIASIAAHSDLVRTLMFLPDGARLVSGSADSTAKIWSVPGGTLLQPLGANAALVRAVALSPDGTLCVTVDDTQTIVVRRASDGSLLQSIQGQAGCVSAIAFSPDSTELASGGGPLDPTIKLWRISNGALLRTIVVTNVVVSSVVTSVGTTTTTNIVTNFVSNGVMALAFSPDGSILASGGDSIEQKINLWNTADGSLRAVWTAHNNGVKVLAFSPDGTKLASGGRRPDNAVKIWSLASIPNGATNASPGWTLAAPSTNNVESIAFAPNNNVLAVGGSGTSALKLWLVSSGVGSAIGTGTNQVFFVAFTPDGGTLAAAGQNSIQFWNVGNGTLTQTITNETFQIDSLAYSPNGNLFLYGRGDATVALVTNSLGALGQPRLTFTSITSTPQGATSIGALVQPLAHYVIQSSSDLSHWSFLSLGQSAGISLSILDSATNPAPRFYRAITPP